MVKVRGFFAKVRVSRTLAKKLIQVEIPQKLQSQILREIIPNSAKALPIFTSITLGLSLVLLNIF